MLPVADMRPVNMMRKLLFGYIIFHFIQVLPLIGELYDPDKTFIATHSLHGFTRGTLVNLLSVDWIGEHYRWFIIVQILFAGIGLLGFIPRISSFLVFFTTVNLQNRIYPTITGGDVLLFLMLFYLSFVSSGKKIKNENLNHLQNAFDRIFIFLIKVQLIIVYAVSAIYKLKSPQWLDGTAVQQILLINEYSFPALQKVVCAVPLIFKLLTWLTLLYQIAFPVLIFVKPVKNYLLVSGLIFHLFIAFGMGLLNFSLVMACCYAVFYDFRREKDALAQFS
ncbi:MAG: hypothetical protein ACXVC6_13450 [Bacteroidia bacterium]